MAKLDASPAHVQSDSIRSEDLDNAPTFDKVDYSGAHEKTDPREIALVRKIDIRIMPILCGMYFMNFLDRNAIAIARLNHLEKDLNLTSSQYQTCVSILFVGYLLGQIPSNMYLTRTKPSRYLSIEMTLWAILSACTALAKNYTGLLLTRFFLGVAEAPFYPGAVYLLTIFYNRKELGTRISILYVGNVLATAFAGLIAAGIFYGLDNVRGLAGWRWMFILQGVATFILAFASYFLLPDLPRTTKWLSQEERELAYNRIELDTPTNGGETSTWTGFKQAVRDPIVWLFALMGHVHTTTCSFKNFFPTVVETLGFNQTITLVLTCPPYLIAGVATIFVSWSSGHFNERTWHITISKTIAATGFITVCLTLNTVARYISMVVFCVGTYGVNSLILAWTGSTCGQTKEKKAVAIAMVVMLSNSSLIWTPYLWPKSDGPRYAIPMGSSAGFSVATIVLAWVAKSIFMRKNRVLKRDGHINLFVY